MREVGYDSGYTVESVPEDPESPGLFTDEDGNRTIGFCLWCNKDFYAKEEVEAHNANDMAACEVFQELKDRDLAPPVLQMMFDQAENQGQEE